MVRATIFVSALFALVATVAAVPRPASLIGVDAGDHVGTGDLNFDEAAQGLVQANGLDIHDVGYDINAVSNDYDDDHFDSDCDHHHHGGLLGRLLKREEAPAGTVRIARKNRGNNMMNNKSAKKAAAAAAAAKMA